MWIVFIYFKGIKPFEAKSVKISVEESMKEHSISKFISWLKSPQMFGNVSKRFPGEWKLYEYYVDGELDILHFEEKDLLEQNQSCAISFNESGDFRCEALLPITQLQKLSNGKWSRSRNYITLMDPSDFRNNIEFQFAFAKGNLRLLKRNADGKIDFFGFFKSQKAK